MAIAFDAATSSGIQITEDYSFNHTPVGTPRGVLIGVSQETSTDSVDSTTYGGTATAAVTGSPASGSDDEVGTVHVDFLGSSVPTGTQSVAVNQTGSADSAAWAVTVTADADVVVQDTTVVDVANGTGEVTGTLSLGGNSCFCVVFVWNGANATGGFAPLTGWTDQGEVDLGAECAACYTYDTIGTADVTFGINAGANTFDVTMIGVALTESGGGGAATVAVPNANTITLQGQTPAVAAVTGATISAPVASMSFGAQTPRAKGGASVFPGAATLNILPQNPVVIAGDTVVPATLSTITLDMQQVFIDAAQASKAAGVSVWEGVSFPEGVTDTRTTVGRGGTNDESE